MKELGLGKLGRNTALTFARVVGAGLLQLITLAVIGRSYGPAGTGVYAVALLLPSMLSSFLSLGLPPAVVYFLGAEKVEPAVAWRACLRLGGILSGAGLVVGGVVVVCWGETWFPDVPFRVLLLALVVFPTMLLGNSVAAMFQGMQKFRRFNLVLFIQPVVMLAAVIALALAGNRMIEALLMAVIVAHVSGLCGSVVLLRSSVRGGSDTARSRSFERSALKYGLKAHLSNVLAFLNYKLDIFLVSFLLGPAATGLYVLAVRIAERLWMLSQSVGVVVLPRLSELSADEDKRSILTPFITRVTLWATLGAALLLALVAAPLIGLVFGAPFTSSFKPLLVLLPGIVLGSSSKILANDTAARGRPELNMYSSIFVVLLNVGANLLLIPRYGISGAALATSFAYSVNYCLRLVIHRWLTGIPWYRNILPERDDLELLGRLISRKGRGESRPRRS